MAKKISNNSIRNIEENWALDDRNGNPYSGASVQEFLKNALLGKAGDFFFDADSNKYLIFADQQRREQYLLNRESNQDLVLGTFDAPANYTTEIYLTTPTSNVILSGTEGNYVDFTFDIKNKNGSSTGESVIATYTFNNSGNIKKATQVYNAGTSVHFLVDQYLEDGTNSITIVITGRNTLVSTMASVTYNVVNLQLTSSFDFSKPYDADQDMPVPYELVGTGVKYVDWYIDGVDIDDLDTIALARVTPTKNIDISNLSEGKHNLQIRAYFSNNGNSYYSKTLYFDFVVAPSGGTFTSNQTHVLLGLILNELVTTTLSVNVTQYQEFSYKASVFDSRNRALSLIITDNGTLVLSISAHSETILDLTYMPVTTGNHTIGFSADTASASITAAVQDSGLGINEVTEGLTLKLSAKGRNNNETNPATWTYGNVTTTFNNFEWNNTCGWNNGALVIPAGSSIDVNFAPLSGTPVLNGRTFEIDFETTNISDETANILNIVDSNTGAGINIKPNTAKLQSAGGASINTRFRDGDRLHLTFIINRTSGDDARFIYIVNNGIVERAARFAATDNFNVSTLMHIGSTGCTIKLHSIKVYDKAITIDEAFQNYAIESNNVVEIVNKNDILNDITGLIDVDKVNAKVPVMIITGNINSILSINDKAHKNDWNTYPVDIEYRNMLNPELNFFIDDADIRLQGTSSISYPRKNFRIYSKSKSDKYATKLYSPTHNPEDLIANGKYSFKAGSAPVSCWCLKADYAESSGSHNVGIAKLWNTVMKNTSDNGNYILRTAAQNWAATNEYEYDVRTTIDGFPIVLFLRDNINAPLVCLGQYNFNNDKSTEEVFGFTELSKDGVTSFDNSAVECWEVLDSDNSIALFTNVSNFDNAWEDAFEARYPKSPTTTALKRVCLFINSCYDSSNDTVDVEAWQQDKADYFDLNKLAAYYVYLLRFGAVDQTVKNAMFTTEDGLHWFYINYDNDTVLGIDNESRQFDVWDYGLFTQTPQGGYYYAGKGKSVLWRLFEADSECMALARHMDALLFNAGLTYEAVCNMFDVEQCGKWCERIYNENGRYKYITQAMEGKNVLHMLQGSRESHRHWWLQHRFEKYDNVFGNGTYSIRSIKARATGSALIPEGAAYKYTPAITTYFGYSVGDNTIDPPTERTANVEYTATGLTQASGVGNFIYIYNANNLAAIDLSAYISALGSLDVSDAKDVYGNSRLTKIVLGDGVNTNAYLTAIGGLSYIAGLEELDIRGYQAITSIDLDDLYNLHTFKAQDSGLTSFKPSAGSTLTSVSLPSGITSLEFNSNTVNSFTYTPTKTLQSLSLTNVSGSWDAKSFTNTWLALFTDSELENVSLTLTGINWTNMTAQQVLNLAKPGTHILRGRVTLSSITYQEYQQIVQVYGQNVFDSSSSFVIDAPAGIYFSGPELVVEGSSVTLSAVAFPVGESIVYHLYDDGGTEINPVEGIATYGGVTLNVNTGALSVGTINTDTYVKLRAVAGQAVSELQRCKIVNITTIGGFTVDGETEFTSTGANTLTIVPALSQYNVAVTSIAVQAQSMSELLSFAYDTLNLTISVTVSAIPSADVTQACTIVVTDELGNEFTSQLSLKIKVVRINDFTIDGASRIVSKGTYRYTITDLLPANHNKDITSIDVLTSPSTGLMITGKTTSGFNLFVTNMPDYTTDVTLTVVATLDNNTSVTKTKTVQLKVVSSLDVLDELGVAIMHKNGTFYTLTEWQSEGFSDALANGVAISDAQTNPNNPTRVVVCGYGGFGISVPQEVSNYVFPDGTQSHIPTINELKSITLVPTVDGYGGVHRVNQYLTAISKTALRTDFSGYDWYYWYKSSEQSLQFYGLACVDIKDGDIGGAENGSWIAVCTPRAVPLNKPVDLGLPSGRLWSNINLGAASAEEAGLYYQWGNVDGHDGEDGYDFSSTHYAETPGGQISEMTLPIANDAANDALGDSWRIPTQADFNELLDTNYTTWLWTTINKVNGYRITSKLNGNSIFIPMTGYIDDSGVKRSYTSNGYATVGSYWTANLYNLNTAFLLQITVSNKQTNYSTNRYYAQAIRPVLDPPELIGDASVGAGTHNYTITRLSNISSISASVSTPTAGSVSVSTSGTTTVVLNVTDIPNDDESVTLTVVATLTDGSTKTITKSVLLLGEEYVDLGLPSGLLWCKHNLGAQSITDNGLYFAWGETTGYADAAARNTALGRSDGFSSDAYTATGGAAITDSVLTWAHDAAAQIMGGDWRMPTAAEFQELYDNCNSSFVTINGMYGMRFTSKNNGNSIFLPASGCYRDNELKQLENYGMYYSSIKVSSERAGICYFDNGDVYPQSETSRNSGYTIRPVCMPTKTVDLDLPSGTLWADRNVGAVGTTDYGSYFSWGNVDGHKPDSNGAFTDISFGQTTYDSTSGAALTGDIVAGGANDAAAVNLGGSWKMPSTDQFVELFNSSYTTNTWTTVNGVSGILVTSKSNGNTIFFPAAGLGNGTTRLNGGSYGLYWSRSLQSSTNGYILYFDASGVNPQSNFLRFYGFSVRAVQ